MISNNLYFKDYLERRFEQILSKRKNTDDNFLKNFSVAKNFEKENFQFNCQHQCFFCPEIAHDAQIYCKALKTLNKTKFLASPRLGCQKGPVQIPCVAIFFACFLLLFNASFFWLPKSSFFRQISRFFDKSAHFSQELSLF